MKALSQCRPQTFARIVSLLFAMSSTFLAASNAHAELVRSSDGQTVFDTTWNVTWLADANLAAGIQTMPDGPHLLQLCGCQTNDPTGTNYIGPSGAMNYSTALNWVAALNAVGYAGHTNWTLPFSPTRDGSCSVPNGGTNNNSFGFGCANSALGSLFYQSLRLDCPNAAVSTAGWLPATSAGLFTNLQPYLYWSENGSVPNRTVDGCGSSRTQNGGFNSFSFSSGWQGSNVDQNFLYVLPMFFDPPASTTLSPCSAAPALKCSPGGTMIFDPNAPNGGVTYLADADFPETLITTCDNDPNADGCSIIQGLEINQDGSMTHTTAENFVSAMNHFNGNSGWLGQQWSLPPTDTSDTNCGLGKSNDKFGLGCTGSPMGNLYYNLLGLRQGTPAMTPGLNSNTTVGPFTNVQPYLYWSCQSAGPQDPTQCKGAPANNFQWSFSFGNGFQGTDRVENMLYVMVYSPEPGPRFQPLPGECRGTTQGQQHHCV